MAHKTRKMNVFEKITYAIKGAESAWVELLTTIGPWLAPMTPAYMTYRHVTTTLGFDVIWGICTAASVEILGLASGQTIAKFYMYNKQERAKGRRLPILPVLFTFGFYLAVVITINMALDWGTDSPAMKLAKLGLILLSVPAIIIVAVRAQHTRLLMEKEGYEWVEDDDPIPTTEPIPAQLPEVLSPRATEMVRNYLEEKNLSAFQVRRGEDTTPISIATTLNLNPTSVRTALMRIRNEKGNGHGS